MWFDVGVRSWMVCAFVRVSTRSSGTARIHTVLARKSRNLSVSMVGRITYRALEAGAIDQPMGTGRRYGPPTAR